MAAVPARDEAPSAARTSSGRAAVPAQAAGKDGGECCRIPGTEVLPLAFLGG